MHTLILRIVKKPISKIIVSLLILALLLWWLPVEELKKTLQKISFFSWFIVLIGFMGGHLVGVIKWRLLINIDYKILPFTVAVRCYFAGLFSNLFLPSLAGGDIVKAGLAIRYNKKKSLTIFATLLDRIIDTGSVVFLIFIAAFLSPQFLQPADQQAVYLIVGFFLVLFFLAILFMILPHQAIKNKKIKGFTIKAKQALYLAYQNPLKPLQAFCLSLVVQTSFIFLTVFLAKICGIDIPLILWFLVWPLAKLSALLPISLGGIGVREVALAALLSRLSIPVSDSVALGLLWESILITGGILGGIIYFSINQFSNVTMSPLRNFKK